MLDLLAAYYLTILWLALIVIAAKKNWPNLMMLGLLFLIGANINSWLDGHQDLQSILRMVNNTIIFAFLIYASRKIGGTRGI